MTLTKAGFRRIHGPRDLPDLRAHLLHSWRPGGALSRAIEEQRQIMRATAHPAAVGDVPTTLPEDNWHRRILGDAALWWVDADMCDLLAAAEKGLPHDTLLGDRLVSTECGLVVFAKPFVGLDGATGVSGLSIDAMAWGPVRIIDTRGAHIALGIASYQRMRFEDGLTKDEMEHAIRSGAFDGIAATGGSMTIEQQDGSHALVLDLTGDVWAPLGRSDWIEGTRLDDPHEGQGQRESLIASAVEDRARLATLWLLASQPGMAETREDHLDRPTRRREQRAGRDPSPVTIVMLPRRARAPRDDAEPTGRHQKVRSWVEGFWRNQAYGPGRAYRRPTYVPGFWRGPEDGPLHVPERVRVVRSLTDEELEAGA